MMPKLVINTVDEFQNLTDKELGVSEWLTINQTMIDHFADATLDHQWIHIDSQRAKEGSPFGSTIAHGYLLVSLIPHFLEQIFSVSILTISLITVLTNWCSRLRFLLTADSE